MISISTTVFDLEGSRVFNTHAEPVLSSMTTRTSRTKTLDVSTSIVYAGCTDKDRDFILEMESFTEADVTFLERIFKYYSEVSGACSDGFFTLVPVSITHTSKKLTATFFVKEKINE